MEDVLLKKIMELESRLAHLETLPSGGAWVDYSATSTVVGWSSFTNKQIYYKRIGVLILVRYAIAGTSDATTATFTLPYAPRSVSVRDAGGRSQDNGGANTVSLISMDASATLVQLGHGVNVPGGFTASGTKAVTGSFWFVKE